MEEKYIIPSGSLIGHFSNKVKQFGGINFAQGLPGFNPPDELLEILCKIAAEPVHQYALGNGDLHLTNAIIQKYNSTYHTSFDTSNVLITNGATEAISLVFTYLWRTYGNSLNVLSMNPVYESYRNLPEIFHCKHTVFEYNDDNTVDFEKLEQKIKSESIKLIFIGTPGNPMGKIWCKQEIDLLLNLSRLLNFFVIIDAVYNELYFNTPTYLPLKDIGNNVFYINSFSKSLSITGWRIGYLICNDELMTKIRSIHDYTGLSSPHLLQRAIASFLIEHNYGSKYIAESRSRIRNSYTKMGEALINLGFEIPPIDGGYFIWTRLPKPFNNGFRFAVDLYEQKKVAVVPGIHFSEKAIDFIRINIARLDDEIDEGIEKLNNFFKK